MRRRRTSQYQGNRHALTGYQLKPVDQQPALVQDLLELPAFLYLPILCKIKKCLRQTDSLLSGPAPGFLFLQTAARRYEYRADEERD
jgi:hypothetical protein